MHAFVCVFGFVTTRTAALQKGHGGAHISLQPYTRKLKHTETTSCYKERAVSKTKRARFGTDLELTRLQRKLAAAITPVPG